MKSTRTGSVLMEFLLVLPVYFVLIGGTFAVGEILVRAIHVTWADRALATNHGSSFDGETYTAVWTKLFPSNTYEYDDDQYGVTYAADTFTRENNSLRADADYKGSWSWQTATKVTDVHNRTPWTRGWLFSAANWLDAMTDEDSSKTKNKATSAIGETAQKIGSVVSIVSGKRQLHKYNYYTLVRTDLGCSGRRSWEPKNLTEIGLTKIPVMKADWFENVYGEKFAVSDPRELDKASQDADELPEIPDRSDYQRFVTFMLWSQ